MPTSFDALYEESRQLALLDGPERPRRHPLTGVVAVLLLIVVPLLLVAVV